MHLQVRIVAATLLLAALAIGTGTVLLLGYLLAAFSIGVIIFIMTRKMIKRIAKRAPCQAATLATIVGPHLPHEQRESAPRGVIGGLANFDVLHRQVPLAASFTGGAGAPVNQGGPPSRPGPGSLMVHH